MRLYTVDELRSAPRATTLCEVYGWVRDVIARPNRDLGRSGAVCPFVPSALQLDTIHFAIEDVEHPNERAVAERVRAYRDVILDLEPRTGDDVRYKTIVVVFPGVKSSAAPRVIDGAQLSLKPYFVERGLMLGEFHPLSENRGIHSEQFRPLRSPVPLIVIRYMVPGDIHFLLREEDSLDARLDFVLSYLRTFEHTLGNKARELAHDSCRDLRAAMEADRDPSTGVASRRLFDETLREALDPCDGETGWLALLLVEVAGSEPEMAELAALLAKRLQRDRLLIARFSKQKLALLMPGLDNPRASIFGEDVLNAMAGLTAPREGGPLRVSIGGASIRCRALALGALVSAAGHALQEAKAETTTCLRMATAAQTTLPPVPSAE